MPCPIFSQYLNIQLTLVSASQDSAGLGQARRVHADRLWLHAGLCPTGSKVGLAWERMSCVGRIRRSTARTLQGASPRHTMLVPSKLCHTQWQSLLQKPLGCPASASALAFLISLLPCASLESCPPSSWPLISLFLRGRATYTSHTLSCQV